MKISIFQLLFCSMVVSSTDAIASSATLSPVSRVVELLKGLSKQIEEEGEKEQDLYETYVCWAKSVVEQKTASNAAAASRIDMLETYIADLESGRIELTSERADLEKEVEELMGDLEVATASRKKENEDFLDAESEMKQAIKALSSAIEVLGEATKDHKTGVLIAMRSRLNGGIAALAEQQFALTHAVELGNKFLEKADAAFLNHLLSGDVPSVDWKKLNRKATFKMAYKARSFKIQSVLKKLHQTFDNNLKDATKKEADAKASYDKLSKAKQDQLDAARTALTKMESENGAKGMSKQDSKDEVADLKKQVKADEKFISETTDALEAKKKEWKARQTLRSGELEAISKAIYILHNDDARDNFKKSFASQGFFLQTDMVAKKAQRASGAAAAALREAAHRSGDRQLLVLAASLTGPSVKTKFGPVIDAIDKMITILKGNEKKDLETKQSCEEDRMADTRKAVLAGREIDDMTDLMTQLTQDIKTLKEEIEKIEEEHKKVKDELDAATKIREDENSAWKVTNKEDEEAAATVQSAADVIKKFYSDNNLVLAQKGMQPSVTAGEAPPPPPPTWEGGYGGKTGESQGIVALLDMVYKDIVKDQTTAKAEEDEAQNKYDAFKKESEDQMKDLMDEKNDRSRVMGKKETRLEQTKKSRGTKKDDLDALLEKMEKINPNCEYFMVNYPLRLKNRQLELDGLEKAKAILQGGVFSKGPDPNREIKPGDAASASFLQINRH
jgi:chromosome segregation ATPase